MRVIMAGRWADCWQENGYQNQKLRLDPCQLPQKISFKGQNSVIHAVLTEKNIVIQRYVALHRKGNNTGNALFKLQNNLIYIVSLTSYKGVSAHRFKGGKNDNMIALMLVHKDPSLSIPLLISDNYDDVLLDWRLWADLYDLPMMVIDEFEDLRPVRECAPLDYFLREYFPVYSLFYNKSIDGRPIIGKKSFQLRLPNRRLKLRLKLSSRLIVF